MTVESSEAAVLDVLQKDNFGLARSSSLQKIRICVADLETRQIFADAFGVSN